MTRFNDNRRIHLFVVDVATARVEQLTDGEYYEHSVEWSPNGQELLFLTNRDVDHDVFFNYDIYAMKLADKSIRRLSTTESNEYHPQWSPDGKMIAFQATKSGRTERGTAMEGSQVWERTADGTSRRDVGAGIDNRQGVPEWTADSSAVLFTVQERGNVRLYRMPANGGKAEIVVNERGTIGSFSARGNTIAYALATPADQAELYVTGKKIDRKSVV